jgi:hypothetical protein
MAYLWFGGEDTSLPNGAIVTVSTTTTLFRSAYARCALGGGSLAAPCKGTQFPGGAVTTCWFTFRNGNNNTLYIGLGQLSQANFLAIQMSNTTVAVGSVIAGTFTAVATQTVSRSVPDKVDVQIANYGTGTVTVNVYLNGTQVIAYSGALAVTGVSGFDSVFMAATANAYSEMAVSNSSTLAFIGLGTIAGTGNGTTQSWSNPAYTNWNPTTITDSNATFTNTTAQDEQATINALPSGSYVITAVKFEARAMATSGATAANLKQGVRNASGTIGVGSTHALTTAFATYEDYMTTDPTTSAAWSTLTSYQLNLRSA